MIGNSPYDHPLCETKRVGLAATVGNKLLWFPHCKLLWFQELLVFKQNGGVLQNEWLLQNAGDF